MLYGRDVAPGEKERDKMEGYRWKAAVVTLSDKGYAGEREDKSGPLICEKIGRAHV